jgi:hypothetical protein
LPAPVIPRPGTLPAPVVVIQPPVPAPVIAIQPPVPAPVIPQPVATKKRVRLPSGNSSSTANKKQKTKK